MATRNLRLPAACATLITFLVMSAAAQEPLTPGKSAALVNGEAIPRSEVEAILKVRPFQSAKPNAAEHLEIQREALDMLIDDVILRQFLRKNAPAVRPAAVSKQLNDLQASLKVQGQTLESYCRESGLTESQLRTTITTMLQRNFYIAEHVKEAAVRKYYDENREFFDQVTVRASHILARIPRGSSPADVATARGRLQALRQSIVSGKLTFADAAKQHSECPSAPAGGDIGYFPRKGAVEEPFALAAFGLKKDEVSDVVQTSYGLHIILVTDRKSGAASDFKKIEEKVRELAGEEMMLGIVARERQGARIEIKLEQEPEQQKSPTRRSLWSTR